MGIKINIKVCSISCKVSGILYLIGMTVHYNLGSHRHFRAVGIHGKRMISFWNRSGCRMTSRPLTAADGTTAISGSHYFSQRCPCRNLCRAAGRIIIIHLIKHFFQILLPLFIHHKSSLPGPVLHHIHHERIIEVRHRSTILRVLIGNDIIILFQFHDLFIKFLVIFTKHGAWTVISRIRLWKKDG